MGQKKPHDIGERGKMSGTYFSDVFPSQPFEPSQTGVGVRQERHGPMWASAACRYSGESGERDMKKTSPNEQVHLSSQMHMEDHHIALVFASHSNQEPLINVRWKNGREIVEFVEFVEFSRRSP